MLTDKDKADLHALNADGKKTAIAQQISRIHAAVNDGTLDRDAVNDALERLTELTGNAPKADSFADFTGQKPQGINKDSFGNSPQGVATPPAPAPQVTGQPDPHPNPNFPNRPIDPARPPG